MSLQRKYFLLTSGSGAAGALGRGKAILGASGVRRQFSCSFLGGVVNFWPICCSMTSQAAVEKYKVTPDLGLSF